MQLAPASSFDEPFATLDATNTLRFCMKTPMLQRRQKLKVLDTVVVLDRVPVMDFVPFGNRTKVVLPNGPMLINLAPITLNRSVLVHLRGRGRN